MKKEEDGAQYTSHPFWLTSKSRTCILTGVSSGPSALCADQIVALKNRELWKQWQRTERHATVWSLEAKTSLRTQRRWTGPAILGRSEPASSITPLISKSLFNTTFTIQIHCLEAACSAAPEAFCVTATQKRSSQVMMLLMSPRISP